MPRVFALVLLLLLAACGAPAAPDQAVARLEPTAPAASPAPSPATEPVTEPDLGLFDFSVAAVGGGQIEGADLAGRDVALWFWAPW